MFITEETNQLLDKYQRLLFHLQIFNESKVAYVDQYDLYTILMWSVLKQVFKYQHLILLKNKRDQITLEIMFLNETHPYA